MVFVDRVAAGRALAQRLAPYRGTDVLVLGLPRGGVPVAYEVARALDAPLDVTVVRKLGVPFQPELAMGAVGEDGSIVLNEEVVGRAHISEAEFAEVARRERLEVEQRARRFRGDRPRLSLAGRSVIVVDDGIATGATARAACKVVRAQGARRIVLAVPVCPPEAPRSFAEDVDDFVYLQAPRYFLAVGQAYRDFTPTSDQQVVELLRGPSPALADAAGAAVAVDPGADRPVRDEEISLPVDQVRLAGQLTVPEHARGVVVFAHGSGSSRHSPRNHYVARALRHHGLATLLFDLLTPAEEHRRSNVFDIDLLARRLTEVSDWVHTQPDLQHLAVGYFGASTGAAAALCAAAASDQRIAAVVSRGGRPDLAATWLTRVRAPTLLIVGGRDELVLELNRRAQRMLRCPSELAVVPGATHLFEEPGTLDRVSALAGDWFIAHLAQARQHST